MVERRVIMVILPGSKVCLNPETNSYKQYSILQNTTGYVVKFSSYSKIESLKYLEEIPNKTPRLLIKFQINDTKKIYINLYPKEILLINAPIVDVKVYTLNDCNIYALIGDEQDDEIDNLIFNQGMSVISHYAFDKEWREKAEEIIALHNK